MKNSLICLSSNYRSDDFSIVRLGESFGSSTSHVITNHSVHEVIHITDDSDSERLSRSSPYGGDFSSDSSCDVLFFYDNAEGGRIFACMPTSFQSTNFLTSTALLILEIQTVIINMEDAKDYI